MAFKSFNFYSTVSNIQNIKTQISHYEYWNENDNDVTEAGYFPEVLGLKAGDRITVYSDDKEDCAEYYVKADGSLAATGLTVVKADLGDLGDQVAGIEAKLPTAPTAAGAYVLTVTVDSEGAAVYSWEANA